MSYHGHGIKEVKVQLNFRSMTHICYYMYSFTPFLSFIYSALAVCTWTVANASLVSVLERVFCIELML